MAQALSIAYAATPLAAGTKLVIYATGQFSAGRNFIRPSEYRFIQVTAAAAASPANVLAAYTAKFGALVAGQKFGIKCVPVNSSGFQGVPIESIVTVV